MRWSLGPALIFYGLLTANPLSAVTPDSLEQARQTLKSAKIDISDKGLLEFFQSRAVQGDFKKINELVRKLGDDDFSVRESAARNLTRMGASSIPALLTARRSPDLEVRRRAIKCLKKINHRSKPRLVTAAAQLLAHSKPEGSAKVLLQCLPTIIGEEAVESIHRALTAIATTKKDQRQILIDSLDSELGAAQAGAAVALSRAGVTTQLESIRKLLNSPDPMVRLQVGLALAHRHEKEAIPVLIQLCSQLPRARLWQVEDLLYQLAIEKAPNVPFGQTEASVKKFQEAWMSWWAKSSKTLDLKAKLTPKGTLGYTLIALLDEGKILELDKKNKPRFTIEKVGFPLDIEMLPGERILMAEHGANKVTERHRDGTILWEYEISEPLVAQRLKYGRTFIGSKQRLLILDRAKKVQFSYTSPNTSETFMRAKRLPNGDIVCVTSYSRFYRLSSTGKQLKTFSVNVHTSGGRIAVLPNGHILIPEMYNDQVVEYNTSGAQVKRIPVNRPIVASLLPNGNLMVTCMEEKRAVELDKNNKVVWQHKHETRVTRAVRR